LLGWPAYGHRFAISRRKQDRPIGLGGFTYHRSPFRTGNGIGPSSLRRGTSSFTRFRRRWWSRPRRVAHSAYPDKEMGWRLRASAQV